MCGQLTHTKIIIIDIHFTVNITNDKIVHVRNNSDWSYVFTIEVDIMFCVKIENIAHYRTYQCVSVIMLLSFKLVSTLASMLLLAV